MEISKHKIFKFIPVTLIFLFILLALSACLPGDGARTIVKPAGFFTGVWHGWIAPISLIVGILNPVIRIYETYNTGWWYDLGFYIAIISGFGGISFMRKKRDK
ncbi:hypothetical protein KJ762_15340 [bacterium]|nr:hypothetical protein [bacterium]MBU1065161.1 hypothetical protein [bacterium]MBU1635861.1 hypothetical protein [bacterium]MBU1873482.1 hypothetical protein [bacterium]